MLSLAFRLAHATSSGAARHARWAAAAATVAAVSVSSVGCQGDEGIREITVNQLAERLDSPEPPSIYDANSTKVRHEYGVIAGATLLDSASDYELSHLPSTKDQSLVFYCSSTWCSAAKTAARRARDAGYSDIHVLAVGIKGWKSAGKPTREPTGTAHAGG